MDWSAIFAGIATLITELQLCLKCFDQDFEGKTP